MSAKGSTALAVLEVTDIMYQNLDEIIICTWVYINLSLA